MIGLLSTVHTRPCRVARSPAPTVSPRTRLLRAPPLADPFGYERNNVEPLHADKRFAARNCAAMKSPSWHDDGSAVGFDRVARPHVGRQASPASLNVLESRLMMKLKDEELVVVDLVEGAGQV